VEGGVYAVQQSRGLRSGELPGEDHT
jgi:hypothetical protein